MDILTPRSKEFLQNYQRDGGAYLLAVRITQAALQHAQQGKTRYAHLNIDQLGPEFSSRHNRNANDRIQVVIGFLRQAFPDSIVEYREAVHLSGNVERGIVIDWS